jgi:hypothetical protein
VFKHFENARLQGLIKKMNHVAELLLLRAFDFVLDFGPWEIFKNLKKFKLFFRNSKFVVSKI